MKKTVILFIATLIFVSCWIKETAIETKIQDTQGKIQALPPLSSSEQWGWWIGWEQWGTRN